MLTNLALNFKDARALNAQPKKKSMNWRTNSDIESTVTDMYDKCLKELLLRTVQELYASPSPC